MEIRRNNLKGFTLIEIMIGLSIFGLLLGIYIPMHKSVRENIALKNDSYEIVNALRLAQSRSISSQAGVEHGVHFTSSSYTLYDGSWPGVLSEVTYSLKQGLAISTGAGSEVVFSRLIGDTADASVVVTTVDGRQRTIIIEKSGNIKLN